MSVYPTPEGLETFRIHPVVTFWTTGEVTGPVIVKVGRISTLPVFVALIDP